MALTITFSGIACSVDLLICLEALGLATTLPITALPALAQSPDGHASHNPKCGSDRLTPTSGTEMTPERRMGAPVAPRMTPGAPRWSTGGRSSNKCKCADVTRLAESALSFEQMTGVTDDRASRREV
jgi:hypothetical protein